MLGSVVTDGKKMLEAMRETLGETKNDDNIESSEGDGGFGKCDKDAENTGGSNIVDKIYRRELTLSSKRMEVISNLPSNESESKTVVRKLLEDSVNGNQIVSRHLDTFLKTTGNNPDSEEFAIEVDFTGIVNFDKNSPKQFRALYDIFDIFKNGNDYEKDYPLITHPVIALFVWKKWNSTRYPFYLAFAVYSVFLIFYSLMVVDVFSITETQSNNTNITEIQSGKTSNISTSTIYQIILMIGMIIFAVLLLIWEFFQAFRLKMLYFKEIENFIEIFVFLSSFCLVIYKVKFLILISIFSTIIN